MNLARLLTNQPFNFHFPAMRAKSVLVATGVLVALASPGTSSAHSVVVAAKLSQTSTASVPSLPPYDAKAGMLNIGEDPERPDAEIFHVDYVMKGAVATKRPVTFVFNGGPGGASIFLHMAAIGPKIMASAGDGSFPSVPARLEDNPNSWISFTDLVFIDPVGTGYSRTLAGPDGKLKDPKQYYSVTGDVDSFGQFIQQWLTVNKRWGSPKAMVGESYGGQRAAALTRTLAESYQVNLNWVVLFSPAFYMQLGSPLYDLVTPMSMLPSYAAIAAHHGKSSITNDAAGIKKAEDFAMTDYIVGLANVGRMNAKDQTAFYAKVAGLTGMDPEVVAASRGRIPAEIFAVNLLRSKGKVIDTYDGRQTSDNAMPEKGELSIFDRTVSVFSGIIVPPFMDYLQKDLGYVSSRPYVALSLPVNMSWDRSAKVGGPDDLAIAMAQNHDLKTLIMGGYYDLNANYLLAPYLLEQTVRGTDTRKRLFFSRYFGGHMFYLNPKSRVDMTRDARNFFEGKTKGLDTLTGPG